LELDELRAQIPDIQRVMVEVATHRANIGDEK
jgi:hypothetical protein